MTRAFYRGLVWLHPPSFRRQFSGEMLWIFDEASPSFGAGSLLADVAVSLVRQWFLGWGAWKILAAMLGAVIQILMVTPLATLVRAPARNLALPHAITSHDMDFSRGLALLIVVLVFGTGLRAYAARDRRHN